MKPINELVVGDEVRNAVTFANPGAMKDMAASAAPLLDDWQDDIASGLAPGLVFEATDEPRHDGNGILIGLSRVLKVIAVS